VVPPYPSWQVFTFKEEQPAGRFPWEKGQGSRIADVKPAECRASIGPIASIQGKGTGVVGKDPPKHMGPNACVRHLGQKAMMWSHINMAVWMRERGDFDHKSRFKSWFVYIFYE